MSHRNLKFVKQDQPSFIRKFKERAGLKPESKITDKMRAKSDECNDEEKEDEKPVVVVLGKGDLTAEQAEACNETETDGKEENTGKIVFRKPTKRLQGTALSATTKKPKVTDSTKKEHGKEKPQAKDKRSVKKKQPNQQASSLLSFNEEDG